MLVKFNRKRFEDEIVINVEKIVFVESYSSEYSDHKARIILESGELHLVIETPSEVLEKIQSALVPATLEVTTSPETLTLRDHFAMAVLPKLALTMGAYSAAARHAYGIADEMIMAREQKGGEVA